MRVCLFVHAQRHLPDTRTMWVSAAALMVVALVVGGGRGFPEEDRVVKLPGQPAVKFRQYAGYVDVDVRNGRSFFYYFVEAAGDADHKPLALWINGGPGCSSVGGGAFMELGPFFPKRNGQGLRINPYSWNKASNLLFVDSPAGVGWSYSNTSSDYTFGDASTAMDMHAFLAGWYEKFPTFRTRGLFLTGESHAGHSVPQLAIALLDHNDHSEDFVFNIQGVAIGNPLLRLDRDTAATYISLWSHGIISDEVGLTILNDCDFDIYTLDGPHNVSSSCSNAISEANKIIGDYVITYGAADLDVCYPSLVEQELRLQKKATKISHGADVCMDFDSRFYFNLPEVQKALHANRTNLPYSWSICTGDLSYHEQDVTINILPLLKRIVGYHGIPVLVFSGDENVIVPLIGSRNLVRVLAEDLQLKITVPYGAWFHEKQVAGWATEYGNLLTFATVRGAAHMVPYAQPSRALGLFSSLVRGRKLPNNTRSSVDN